MRLPPMAILYSRLDFHLSLPPPSPRLLSLLAAKRSLSRTATLTRDNEPTSAYRSIQQYRSDRFTVRDGGGGGATSLAFLLAHGASTLIALPTARRKKRRLRLLGSSYCIAVTPFVYDTQGNSRDRNAISEIWCIVFSFNEHGSPRRDFNDKKHKNDVKTSTALYLYCKKVIVKSLLKNLYNQWISISQL